ncbi:TetR/AcrR family transcriptional regulator [Halioxenophilus sp. WMMB6]|uniref:TetR/AcrR family transcriptional regulator n=1 Tax=Halioxenophilus sp. WMMB6 TaxID=3073815 RepID=UPI00295E6775|nr:TetR/AcrR family transcriptional regulator [Halioxenophilus sp. WMMB6]
MTASKAPAKRRRNDPRTESTRLAIIECAERLFAEKGVVGVSLRQIGSEIGSSNNSVVAYHFGTKEGLLAAIFHHRLPAIEARRAELLAAMVDDQNLRELLAVLWQPLYEQRDADGRHSYASFLAAITRSPLGIERLALNSDYPVTTQLGERIRALLPDQLKPRFPERLQLIAILITGTLQSIDQITTTTDAQQLFDDALSMAAVALIAPTR